VVLVRKRVNGSSLYWMDRKIVREYKRNVSKNGEKCIEECTGAYSCYVAAAKSQSLLPKVQIKRKQIKRKREVKRL